MAEAYEVVCPYCGKRGRTRTEPTDGASIQCTQCRGSFVYRTGENKPIEPRPEPTPAPEPPAEASRDDGGIERRLRELERWNRGLAAACGLLLLGLCGSFYAAGRAERTAAAQAFAYTDAAEVVARVRDKRPEEFQAGRISAEEVVARRVLVVDEGGKALVTIGKSENGPPMGVVMIQESTGATRVMATAKGCAFVDARDKPRIVISASNERKAGIGLLDTDGKTRCVIEAGEDLAQFQVTNADERPAIEYGVDHGFIKAHYRDPADGKLYAMFPNH